MLLGGVGVSWPVPALLLWLWGPMQLGVEDAVPLGSSAEPTTESDPGGTAITLRQRNALAVWGAIRERLDGAVQAGLSNATGRLLAIEGLNPERRRELLLALLQQLDQVLAQLRTPKADRQLPESWNALQPELRRQALTAMTGSYVQLPKLA